MLLAAVLLLAAMHGNVNGQQDPCSEAVYSHIPHLVKRNPSYAEDSSPICDRYLEKQWYRAGFHQMPNFGPELTMCGTLYPYWMNGTIPENGTMARVTVCQVGFQSKCVQSHTIRVKNCGLYAVYELIPLASCNSAYCFQPSSTCVEGVPRNISVSYHNVSWESSPNKTASNRIHTPSVNLICNFTPILERNVLYEVNWYVDNKEALRNQTLTAGERMNAILSASQILKIKGKAGSMIHCVVGAKFRPKDSPCSSKSSPLFFAGIKLLTQRVEIKKNQSAVILFQLTIPFADQTLVLNNEEREATLYISSVVHHGNHVSCENRKKNNCGTNITSYTYSERGKYATDEWKGIKNLTFYNSDDGDYTIDKHLILRLQTNGTRGGNTSPSKIFDEVLLPDVQIMIVDNETLWKGRYCSSTTDPNIWTFDRNWYQCMLLGTFLLYKNDVYNQEVQEKHFMCTQTATCNCAVAVRSGRDVFTIDMCNRQKEIINFPLCDDSVLKVVKKMDRRYQVLLPTGTRVDISIHWGNNTGWFLKIYIYASPSDVGNTQGLCGILDGNKENDFTGRNNIQYSTEISHPKRPDAFSNTWLIKSDENLLMENQNVYSRLKSISNTLARVCLCNNSTGPYRTVCNYGNFIDCKFTVGKRYHCITHAETLKRRKRDLKHLQTLKRFSEKSISDNMDLLGKRYKRETSSKNLTFEEARSICLTVFEKSEAYITCRSFVVDLKNSSLENCISDLQITGMVEFADIHLEETLDTCSEFILVNSTFQDKNPEVTYQIQTLCPWNCSGNGVCNKGNCTCYAGYAGSDCSFDLSGPPTITHVSDFGFCDKSNESCDEITVYGKYFIENMNTFCHMTRLMYDIDGAILLTESYKISLEERTLFEGYCPLQYSSLKPWLTFFLFNISNDDKRFTGTFNVYTFQSLCQEYQNNSGDIVFTFKDGFCFIDGNCVIDGETNPRNLCDICNVARNRYGWTFNEGLCQIDGKCVAGGEVEGSNFCRFCSPHTSNTSWSLHKEFCFIGNRCYFTKEPRHLNHCEICDPDENHSDWTLNKDCITNPDPNNELSTDSPTESAEPVIEPKTTLESTTIGKTSEDPTWFTTHSTTEQKKTMTSTAAPAETSPVPKSETDMSPVPKPDTDTSRLPLSGTDTTPTPLSDTDTSPILLSDTDIITTLCASGISIAVVIVIAFVVYRRRMLTKESKTKWTIPNIKNTSKELPGISLMRYTKK